MQRTKFALSTLRHAELVPDALEGDLGLPQLNGNPLVLKGEVLRGGNVLHIHI